MYGDHVVGASGKVRIKADAGLVLECGDSKIEVTKDGIKISGKTVALAGSESTTMKGKGPSLNLADEAELSANKIRFFAKDSWLVLDKNVKMKGEFVKVNCDDEKPVEALEELVVQKKKTLKMKLSDANFTAYDNRKFQLVVDGDTYEGVTTNDGIMEKEVPEDAKSLLLVVWIGDYPTGEKRTWTLTNVKMPPVSDVSGAQLRLGNLGYYAGKATGVLDGDTAKAIASFQADSGLPPTGVLDGATAEKIGIAHGS